VAEVARLVRLTATHDSAPGDGAGALLCDADLSILAADPARYDAYAAAVRREYGHVPDDAFRIGRAEVLRHLLGLPVLYRVVPERAEWEVRARANLTRELSTRVDASRVRPPWTAELIGPAMRLRSGVGALLSSAGIGATALR